MAGAEPPEKPAKTSAMPPGMVMGPDGKPCRVCTAFRNWSPKFTTTNATNASDSKANSTAAMMSALATGSAATTTSEPTRPADCPPDSEELGRATWTFLHTTAAYYPEKPTPNQRANMLCLLRALPVLYPCWYCAADFGEKIKASPPDVSGRTGLSRWLCERHNEVNEKLGKERFDCARVDERWKDGPADGSCD